MIADQDSPDLLKFADLYSAKIPRARKVVIRGAAHHPNLEKPSEFNRHVLRFLKSN